MKARKDILILFVLAVIFIVLCTTSAIRKSPVADEAAHHVPTGYVFLKTGDFVYATDSPVLARYLAGFPLLFMDIKLPMDRSFWARDDRAEFSREFLYVLNRDKANQIVFWARTPMIILGALGGIFLFFWVKNRYGSLTAILASFLYFLSPNILAHARFATTDIAATVFIMCSVLTFWDFLTHFSYKRAAISGIFLGLALMAKYSALLLLPVYLILAIFVSIKQKNKLSNICMFVLCLFVGFLVLWGGYAFEFKPFLENALRPEGKIEFFRTFLQYIYPTANKEVITKWTETLYTVPVPLRSYILGVIGVLRHGAEGAKTFFMGAWSDKGHPMYYILAFFIKTPIPVIISFFIGAVISLKNKSSRRLSAYLLFVIILFAVMASRSNLQLGLRYLLPVYPFIFIISALGLGSLFRGQQAGKLIGTAFVLWLCLIHVFIWPDYLSYFNESIGGSSNGYKYLRDSNLDWGQDLPALKERMDRNNVETVKLSYFGEGDPSLYGIKTEAISSIERKKPGKFIYAISADQVETFTWTKDKSPDDIAGHSIFIYDLREKR